MLLLILAGWINRQQQDVIEYLLSENRVLKEKLGKKRILLSDEQRMRLAIKGKILGRKLLEQLAGIVTPDTFLQAHWDVLASIDFTTIEVWTKTGLATCYLLFEIGQRYILRARVETLPGPKTRYSIKSWKALQAEPPDWDPVGIDGENDGRYIR